MMRIDDGDVALILALMMTLLVSDIIKPTPLTWSSFIITMTAFWIVLLCLLIVVLLESKFELPDQILEKDDEKEMQLY